MLHSGGLVVAVNVGEHPILITWLAVHHESQDTALNIITSYLRKQAVLTL